MAVPMARALPRSRLRPPVPDARRRARSLAWRLRMRRLLGPLESVQRDAIVQSLLDYHGSKVKTAESPGVSRATIYRKIRQYGIITPAS
jgi:transcriptional regulator of acetoin/glycerol metabolism